MPTLGLGGWRLLRSGRRVSDEAYRKHRESLLKNPGSTTPDAVVQESSLKDKPPEPEVAVDRSSRFARAKKRP
jgi:hypothetical protein